MWLFRKKPKVDLANLGVIEDPRTDAEKASDYRAEELYSFGAFPWQEVPEEAWHKYPIFSQDGSGSCVGQATTKLMGIENVLEEGKFVHFSARDIYTRRKNQDTSGMWFQDAGEIARKHGATVEQLMPSQDLTESAMRLAKDRTPLTEQIALPGKMKNYVFLPIDMDAIASIIEPTGRGVMLGVAFGSGEWDREVPILKGTDVPFRHAIAATNAILYNNKKAFVIEDSWGEDRGKEGRRIVTEDWFKANRVFTALYFEDLSNTWQDLNLNINKPKHSFKTDLKLGDWNKEVENLQECLRYEGLFAAQAMSTGYYGPITAKSVYNFQKKHSVASESEIEALQGKSVGPKTRDKLNEIFA